MATVRLWTDDEVGKDPAVKAVFDDIRRVRGSERLNRPWSSIHPLRVRTRISLRTSQSPREQHHGGGVEECSGGSQGALEVLG